MSRIKPENTDLTEQPIMHPPAVSGRPGGSLRAFMADQFMAVYAAYGGAEQLAVLMQTDFPEFMKLMNKFAPKEQGQKSDAAKFLDNLPPPRQIIEGEFTELDNAGAEIHTEEVERDG